MGCNVQLFPDGDFAARDGRPASVDKCEVTAWRMDADIVAALACLETGRRFTEVELSAEYAALAGKRICQAEAALK